MSPSAPGAGRPVARDFAAVLFDLDGTLIDSTSAVERSWRIWAAERGLDRTAFTVSHGVPARQVLAAFLPADEVEPAFARIEEIEVDEVDGIRILPGAARALAALPDGCAAIVTSGTPPLVRARLAATGLPAPGVLVTADDVPVGKPDPAPYLLAARRLGVDPRDCLVVEDAPAGLAAGRAAGCTTLGVLTTHPAAELAADALVASLAGVRLVGGPDGVRLAVEPVGALGEVGLGSFG